jgi:hypothetical protein
VRDFLKLVNERPAVSGTPCAHRVSSNSLIVQGFSRKKRIEWGSSLCGITFDGTHLIIPRDVIIEAKCWSAASSLQAQVSQHSLARIVLHGQRK